ncbi:hypothetical protein PNO24_00740 [Gemella haemolysans]|uniref:hypothetical protein n=1 Tax=Gemella haemolysans TaxID=1379 RepID=UPI00232AE5BD|nr:hypothetical protein [Gemella haemolysans]MDB6212454.1 hypothetical protein [Gemella haemolysans]
MYESILTIKKILSGEHYFFKNVWRVTVKYKDKLYAFDKDGITNLSSPSNMKSIPVEFLNSSTEVCICRLELKEEGANNED